MARALVSESPFDGLAEERRYGKTRFDPLEAGLSGDLAAVSGHGFLDQQ